MAYNIKNKLRDNILAVKAAIKFKIDQALSEEDYAALEKYSGWGGIKPVLYNAGRAEWERAGATEADFKIFDDVQSLHEILQNNFSESEYKQIVRSLKHSVLTSFYTPRVIPNTLFGVLKDAGVSPKYLYEPSAGGGVFIRAAMDYFAPENIVAVEKDLLTGLVLSAWTSKHPERISVSVTGFENTSDSEAGKSDFIFSNIPFGSMQVYDRNSSFSKGITSRIHNYFFAKALDKIGDGGLLAFLTTDTFLNSLDNKEAREYLFNRADFVSLSIMPDNLMKDEANTEAPSHLLIVQKNESKPRLSQFEEQLLETVEGHNGVGNFRYNRFIDLVKGDVFNGDRRFVGNSVQAGTNQYGEASIEYWQDGDINDIKTKLKSILQDDIGQCFDKAAFLALQQELLTQSIKDHKLPLTYLPVPQTEEGFNAPVQLGLFDITPVQDLNKAWAYLTNDDYNLISKETARIVNIFRSGERADHDSIVIISARTKGQGGIKPIEYYRVYSNLQELSFEPLNKWTRAPEFFDSLAIIPETLRPYEGTFKGTGDIEISDRVHKLLDRSLQEPALNIPLNEFYKENTLLLFRNSLVLASDIDFKKQSAKFRPVAKYQPSDRHFFEQYIALRDAYLELFNYELKNNVENESLRARLNDLYDAFYSQFGPLNSKANYRKIVLDDAFGFTIANSLERLVNEDFVKSDIFHKAVSITVEIEKADSPIDALGICLNMKGKVDLEYIYGLLPDYDENAIVRELKERIFFNPENGEWESADKFLAGSIGKKIEFFEGFLTVHPDNLLAKEALTALRNVLPAPVPFEQLDFNLGERWMPISYYERFASDFFKQDITIKFIPSIDEFVVNPSNKLHPLIYNEFKIEPISSRPVYGDNLLKHALENTTPTFTYKVELGEGKTETRKDYDAIQQANHKIETIREAFVDWIALISDEEKQELERIYNRKYNSDVLRRYDGSHLTFPGLDLHGVGIDDLYDSQKSAIWRIIQEKGALVDHEVGLGKTLTMVVAAYEMKRLGVANKPMIIGLKANVMDIASTFEKAYPHAKILFPSEKDYKVENRQRIFNQIKNNDWDCVILSHEQFGAISHDEEIVKSIIYEEISNLERDLDELDRQGDALSKQLMKGLEVRKNNLEAKLDSTFDKMDKRKSEISFKEMGIDHLFVDESHAFKNLLYTTRHGQVAGLGTPAGSDRALNMLFAVRTLQERFQQDMCVTFATGTPISNSLVEMYLLFKYFIPRKLTEMQIENFDSWAAVFAKKSKDFEFSVTNEVIIKERYRIFIKVPELARIYNEIADYRTAEHINLDRPKIMSQLVEIEMTPDQKDYAKKLMAFAKTGDASLIDRVSYLSAKAEKKSRMLIATNLANKMAIDYRLINPDAEDHPNLKVNVCAARVHEYYQKSSFVKGTQIIFCDTGTPKSNEFDVYNALKSTLVSEYNIPEKEITFIHSWTDKKRPELFQKMRDGEIRITVGSTSKFGTGVNVQDRVVSMHNIDVTWNPKDEKQRDGRGGRKGNWVAKEHFNNEVPSFHYGVINSLDNFKFNCRKNKAAFIEQIKSASLDVRTVDEGAMDESGGVNYAEYIAVLSGDNTLLEKSKVENKIKSLERLKSIHTNEIVKTRRQLTEDETTLVKHKGYLERFVKDHDYYKSVLQIDNNGVKQNLIRLNGFPITSNTKAEEIGSYLIKLQKEWRPATISEQQERKATIGSLYGYDLVLYQDQYETIENKKRQIRYLNLYKAVSPVTGASYSHNNGAMYEDNPIYSARFFLNAIDKVGKLEHDYRESVLALEANIPVMREIISKPFAKADELKELKEELKELERKMTENLKAQEEAMAEKEKLEEACYSEIVMEGKEFSIDDLELDNSREAVLERIERGRPISNRNLDEGDLEI